MQIKRDLVVVNGESLGGGQSLAVGALDPDVDFVCACVPALSDHNGRLVQRHNGWPHLWKVDANGNRPQSAFKVSEAARYVDTMNFCTLYTPNKEVSIGTGFVDTTCPPDGIYAAFNNRLIPPITNCFINSYAFSSLSFRLRFSSRNI